MNKCNYKTMQQIWFVFLSGVPIKLVNIIRVFTKRGESLPKIFSPFSVQVYKFTLFMCQGSEIVLLS